MAVWCGEFLGTCSPHVSLSHQQFQTAQHFWDVPWLLKLSCLDCCCNPEAALHVERASIGLSLFLMGFSTCFMGEIQKISSATSRTETSEQHIGKLIHPSSLLLPLCDFWLSPCLRHGVSLLGC